MTDQSFASGSLRVTSYARVGKLFTASQELMVRQIAHLNPHSLKKVIDAAINILRSGLSV